MLQKIIQNDKNKIFKRKIHKKILYEGGAHFKYEDLYNILYKIKNKNELKLNFSHSFIQKHKIFLNEQINLNHKNEENNNINYNNYNNINEKFLNEVYNKYKIVNFNNKSVKNLKRNKVELNVLKNKKSIDNLNINNEKCFFNFNYLQINKNKDNINNLKKKLPKIKLQQNFENNYNEKNNNLLDIKSLIDNNSNILNYFSNKNIINSNNIFYNKDKNFPLLNSNKKNLILNLNKKNSVISFDYNKKKLKKNNSFNLNQIANMKKNFYLFNKEF